MKDASDPDSHASLLARLAARAIDPSDDEELRLRKTILLFASGATAIAAFVWLAIYWLMGIKLPTTIPFLYQVLTALIVGIFLSTRNFDFYRMAQLALFLFAPFVIQWSIGSFLNSSGIVLLALLAPMIAMVVYGPRESTPWFAAYLALTILSGLLDYYLSYGNLSGVPMRIVAVFFVLNFTVLPSIVYLVLRYFVTTNDRFQSDLSRQHVLLVEAQNQSERLLNTILPAHIAQRLKQQQITIADGIADVTVMFANIVNFTALAEEMNPKDVVAFLDAVFTRLDTLAEKHGVDKIKTIGDAYMVAGGLSGTGAQYVDYVVNMALDMLRLTAEDEVMRQYNVSFHVGIATGPVTAGVIGTKRFSYDIYGDTVNIARLITGEAPPNIILVDKTTYRRLDSRYEFGPAHDVVLKGKGSMPIYQLLGKRA